MNTNGIGNAYAAQATTAAQSASSEKTKSTARTTKPNGQKEIGNPKLSEKAQKYYDQLRKKYGNMDFILVSADKKEEAEANAAQYASNKLVVLIDEEKIEKMAEDEAYRKQYEGILDKATGQFAQMKASLGSNANSVKTFGMKFDDYGNASFFAVVDKSLAAQRDRIQQKREQKAEEQKKADKKAQKEEMQEKIKEKHSGSEVMVEASSWDELLKKINETVAKGRSDMVQTKEESWVGSQFDYTI